MTTIGTFTPAKDGLLQGKIKTLTLNLAKVTLEPVTSDHESAPAFRLIANGIELGAAWAKTAKESGRATTRSGSMIRASPPRFSPT